MRSFTISLLAVLAMACAAADDGPGENPNGTDAEAAAQVPADLSALASSYVETPVQNELLDVHRIDLPIGEALPPHRGGARAVYALASYSVVFETDGESESRSFAPGDVHTHDAGLHSIRNTGETEASFLVFDRRDGAMPQTPAATDTEIPDSGEGISQEVAFESDRFEVHRVTLVPGARVPTHRGYPRAIYSQSNYTLMFSGESESRERSFTEGDVHYHDPGQHTVENVGDTPAEFLIVEFLR